LFFLSLLFAQTISFFSARFVILQGKLTEDFSNTEVHISTIKQQELFHAYTSERSKLVVSQLKKFGIQFLFCTEKLPEVFITLLADNNIGCIQVLFHWFILSCAVARLSS
jgi:hypothetical protein